VAAELTVLTGADERDLTRLDEYRAIGGYRPLARARKMDPAAVIEEISKASLRGRGGAGFPMGRKLSLVPPAAKRQGPAYVVANADESEPGAFKDREIMGRVPHRFLEGCLIAAHAIQAEAIFIYIRGEYLAEAQGPTSAERNQPCSSHSRAVAANRARGRRSRRSPACTCNPR